MEIGIEEQRVRLSAKAFAEFSELPNGKGTGPAQAWRAAVGQTWHARLRQQAEQSQSRSTFEVPISAKIPVGGWILDIVGRIDQVVQEENSVRLREVKTVSASLPADEAELLTAYPEHVLQLASYLIMAQAAKTFATDKSLLGELVFVDYRAGLVQVVPLPEEADALWATQAQKIITHARERRERLRVLRRFVVGHAFEELRPEQVDTLAHLEQAIRNGSITALQAPTGFGKTGVALEAALKRLPDASVDRVVFLTGKSTGQLQAMQQLAHFAGKDGQGPRFFQLRSKREHAERCPLPKCDGRNHCMESLQGDDKAFAPAHHFTKGTITPDSVLQLSTRYGICPFELSRATLTAAEVWVCDYNYIFSIRHAGLLEGVSGYLPKRTALIVDEAHNLPSRVADTFSFTATASEAEYVLAALRHQSAPSRLLSAWQRWAEFLETLKTSERHPEGTRYETLDLLDGMVEAARAAAMSWEDTDLQLVEAVFGVEWWLAFLKKENLDQLLWSKARGSLRVDCLDASIHIGERLKGFQSATLMSATLDPLPDFWESVGQKPKPSVEIRAKASWRSHAYRVVIDARVDTRLRRRADYYATTAGTVQRLSLDAAAPVAVFFSSYQYAETVRAYLMAEFPATQVMLQPRAVELSGQMRFIEESLLTAHVLFFVLGSSFSESVDFLGGRIDRVMVVGPALPEVNAVQKARLSKMEPLGRELAFSHTYIQPAMRKINQAIGRLVRNPDHAATVLLHCRRFMQPEYRDLLDPDFSPEDTIRTDDELEVWLRELKQ